MSGIGSGGLGYVPGGGGSPITFANSPTVTFGQVGSTVTASAVGALVTAGIGALGAGTVTQTSGTVVFSNINGVSFGLAGAGTLTGSVAANSSLSFSNANGVTFGTNGSTLTASVATQTSISFSNANGVSFGIAGSTVTASVAAAGSINFSGGTTSGNLGSVVFGNANGVSFGLNGSTMTGSVAAQSVQTQNAINVTLAGNTSGALALISSGTLNIAGGNNITISQAGNAITISGANAGGAQTGISGVQVSNTTYTSGTISFQNANGISFGSSGANGISASYTVPTQSVQTQNLVDVSLSGNTSGALGLISSGTVVFAGGNNITLSQNGQSITISGANAGGAQTGISGIQVSNTTYTSGTVTFQNANGISFGSSGANGISASYTVPTQSVQSIGFYASSNTTGQSSSTTFDARSMSVVGMGGISVGASAGSIVISGAAGGGGGAGLSAGTQSVSTGTVVFANSNGISFGMSGSSQITASYTVPTQSVQTQNLVDISLSGNTAGALALVSSGTVIFAGGNNITLSQNGQSITISGANAGGAQTGISGLVVSNTTYTSGTVTFQNANGISFGSSGANGISASYTVPAAQTGISGIVVSNTTYTSGTVTFQNVNGISFGSSGANGISASYTVPSTAGLLSNINISAGTTSGNLSHVTFSNSNGVSFGLNASVITGSIAAQTVQTQNLIAMSLSGNTSGALALVSSGTVILAGGNNITLSQNGQSITISGANAGGVQTGISGIQVSNTTYTSGTVTWQNANGISFGSSGANGVSASYTVPTVISTAGLFALGNTTQNSSTALNLSALSFNGLGAQTVGFSNGSIQLSVPATSLLSATGMASISINGSTISIGAAIPQLSFFQPLGPVMNTTVTQNGLGSVQVYPAIAAFPFTATRVDIMASLSAAVLAVSTQAQTMSMYVGLYSMNGSTLSLASSGSQSYAWTNSSNNSNASITGLRRFSAPINVNYTGGFDLFIGVMTNTTFANTNGISLSNVVIPLGPGPQLQGLIGQVAANSMQFVPGQGFFSATSAAMPSSMAVSAISGIGSGGNAVDYYSPVQFVNMTA